MAKTRVYLSKSNAADGAMVSNVRDRLKCAGFEVVEFLGGTYNKTADNEKLLSADYLVLVPPTKQDVDEDYEVNVGRGQYEQVQSWRDQNHSYEGIYSVHKLTGIYGLELFAIDSDYLAKTDYTHEYATLFGETQGGGADDPVIRYSLDALDKKLRDDEPTVHDRTAQLFNGNSKTIVDKKESMGYVYSDGASFNAISQRGVDFDLHKLASNTWGQIDASQYKTYKYEKCTVKDWFKDERVKPILAASLFI